MTLAQHREKLNRLNKERLKLEDDKRKEREKKFKLEKEAERLLVSMRKTKSTTQFDSKNRQFKSKQDAILKSDKKISDIEKKITRKIEEINRATKGYENKQVQVKKKEEQDKKKRNREELKQIQSITKEKEKQVRLQKEMTRSPLVIDVSKLPVKIKALFLAANSQDMPHLELDREVRAIEKKIRASNHRDAIEFTSKWAVSISDFLEIMNEHKPHIVHFSGHGSADGKIIFVDNGSSQSISQRALVELMKSANDNIQLVVYNACYSKGQAEELVSFIPATIGMNAAIGDETARIFSAQFYSSIGFGKTVQESFEQAKALLLAKAENEYNTPELYLQEDDIMLVRPS